MVLDQESLQAYQKRWQTVEQVVNAERRNATVAERWRKLNSLLRMAVALGLQPENGEPDSDDLIYQRWNHLRAIYLAESQGVSL